MRIQSQRTQEIEQNKGTLTFDESKKLPEFKSQLEKEFPGLIDEQYNFIKNQKKIINATHPAYIFITAHVTLSVSFKRSFYLDDDIRTNLNDPKKKIENFSWATYDTNVDMPHLINKIADLGYTLKFIDNSEYASYKFIMAKIPQYQ